VRRFGTANEKTEVLIVGGGPVGMVLSQMLTQFKVCNKVIERNEENPKQHDKR
jgi:2-polyprenyl-6-methoxyphenol hydroxylase-like FAD-dependent oxidoreductase